MDSIATIVESIVWPIMIIVFGYVFRTKLENLFVGIKDLLLNINKVKYKDFEATFRKEIAKIEEDVQAQKERNLARYWHSLGETYREAELWDDAKEAYSSSISSDKSYTPSYTGWATALREEAKGKQKKEQTYMLTLALSKIKDAVSSEKAFSEPERQMGPILIEKAAILVLLREQDKTMASLEEAKKVLGEAIETNPKLALAIKRNEAFKKISDRKWFTKLLTIE